VRRGARAERGRLRLGAYRVEARLCGLRVERLLLRALRRLLDALVFRRAAVGAARLVQRAEIGDEARDLCGRRAAVAALVGRRVVLARGEHDAREDEREDDAHAM